ncbi:MAG: hypothetical protein ACRD5B_14450 [Nitrososphaeraceae archaeon]
MQTVSRDLLTVDSVGKAVAAILFGFGSPAIANQLAPLIRGIRSQKNNDNNSSLLRWYRNKSLSFTRFIENIFAVSRYNLR